MGSSLLSLATYYRDLKCLKGSNYNKKEEGGEDYR